MLNSFIRLPARARLPIAEVRLSASVELSLRAIIILGLSDCSFIFFLISTRYFCYLLIIGIMFWFNRGVAISYLKELSVGWTRDGEIEYGVYKFSFVFAFLLLRLVIALDSPFII